MDFTRSYVTIFENFVVREQRLQVQGLVNWSSRTRALLEDNNTVLKVEYLTLLDLVPPDNS